VEISRAEFDGWLRRHELEHTREEADVASERAGQDSKISVLEMRMNAHDVLHAGSSGELRGIKRALGWGFAILGALITAFGGTALYIAVNRP
jgi:hypothetical protein